MAVEKSYARLGLFLVIAIVVVLATGLLFIQRMRSREVIELVTYTQENVAGLDISSPVRYRGVAVGRVSNLQVEPGGRTIEIDFELFTDRLTTVGANVTNLRDPATARVFFERLRAQVVGNPVTGEAYLFLDMPENPPPPMTLGFTPNRPYIPSMPTPMSSYGTGCPKCLSASSRRSRSFGISSPGCPTASTGPTGSSPTSNASYARASCRHSAPTRESSSRRRPSRSRRSPRTSTDWSATRARCRSSPTRHALPSTQQTCPPPAAPRARPWTRPVWRRRTCGARCPRSASRSGSCASSRASCRNSRNRWSTASSRERSRNDSGSRYGMLVVLAVACLGGGCRVRLERPDTVPVRMIEPRLVEPGGVAADAPNATSIRLLETQSRGHIGRRVLHQQPGGEVTEDPVWLWATTPIVTWIRRCDMPSGRVPTSVSSTPAARRRWPSRWWYGRSRRRRAHGWSGLSRSR